MEDGLDKLLRAASARMRAFSDTEKLVTERGLCSERGDEYATPQDLGLVWEVGAPMPHLLANGTEAYGTHSVKFGGPNEEALHGHPLHGKGLGPYGPFRVVNSRWIAEEHINSVHPAHRDGWHDRLNHYLFAFHDESLECIAEGITAEHYFSEYHEVLRDLAIRI